MTNRERIGQFLGALGQAVDTGGTKLQTIVCYTNQTNKTALLERLTSYQCKYWSLPFGLHFISVTMFPSKLLFLTCKNSLEIRGGSSIVEKLQKVASRR